MKTKIITMLGLLILTVGFYSFKTNGEKESTNIALISSAFGKNAEGFLIQFGDGTNELVPFEFKNRVENWVEGVSAMAQVMNKMHEKGYRYKGMGSHIADDMNRPVMNYLVFEKN